MLGCIDCKDSRHTCGTVMSSACVSYTGQFPKFVNQEDLACTSNINDIFKLFGDRMDVLIADTNMKTLNPRCLGFDVSDITPVKLADIQNIAICDLKTTVADLKNTVDNLNIGAELITIDLKCLAPNGAACEVAPNTYSLTSILNIIIDQLCP